MSFFILHEKESELVYFRNELYSQDFKQTLKELYETDPVLSKFKEIEYLGLHTTEFTLIPSRLYNPELRSTYFKDLMDLSDKMLLSNVFADESIQILSLTEKETTESIKAYFEIGEVVPNFFGLTQSISDMKESDSLLVNFDDEELLFIYIKEGQIKFLNKFEFNSTADILYYVLKVCTLLKLDPKELSLKLSGHINSNSEIYKTLHKYIYSLSILRLDQNINIPLSDSEIHYFNDIFAMLKK